MTTPSASTYYRLFVGVDIAATSATASWMAPSDRPTRPITIDQTTQGYASLQKQLLDTGLDPVRIIAAAPVGLDLEKDQGRALVVASEYERLSRAWIARRGLRANFLRSYGATEVFPPEDADCIVDNTATGATLAMNGLAIVDELSFAVSHLLVAEHLYLARETSEGALPAWVRAIMDAHDVAHADPDSSFGRVLASLAAPPSALHLFGARTSTSGA